MKKYFTKLIIPIIIFISCLFTINLTSTPIYAKTQPKFSHYVRDFLNNDNNDELTVYSSTAKLKIANGKNEDFYTFKIKNNNNKQYNLKINGKKIDNIKNYALDGYNHGIIKFKYGKHIIHFSMQSLDLEPNTGKNINKKTTNKKSLTTIDNQ